MLFLLKPYPVGGYGVLDGLYGFNRHRDTYMQSLAPSAYTTLGGVNANGLHDTIGLGVPKRSLYSRMSMMR